MHVHTLKFRLIALGGVLIILGVLVRSVVVLPFVQGLWRDQVMAQQSSIATYIAKDIEGSVQARRTLIGTERHGAGQVGLDVPGVAAQDARRGVPAEEHLQQQLVALERAVEIVAERAAIYGPLLLAQVQYVVAGATSLAIANGAILNTGAAAQALPSARLLARALRCRAGRIGGPPGASAAGSGAATDGARPEPCRRGRGGGGIHSRRSVANGRIAGKSKEGGRGGGRVRGGVWGRWGEERRRGGGEVTEGGSERAREAEQGGSGE